MNIPNEVDVLGTKYRVLYEVMGDADGESSQSLRYIKINPNNPRDTQVESFYHELVHLLMDHIGVSYLFESPKVDETFAQALGMGLAYVMSANQLPTFRRKNDNKDAKGPDQLPPGRPLDGPQSHELQVNSCPDGEGAQRSGCVPGC